MNSPYGSAPRRIGVRVQAPVEEVIIWDIDDVCGFLKVTKDQIYKWNSQGSGPPYARLGKSLRYKKSDVLAWYESLPKSTD